MQSTGTGSDTAFAHAVPHTGPCEVIPGDAVPRRTIRGHLTIPSETNPTPTAPLGFVTNDYPTLSYPQMRASSTVQRKESPGCTDRPNATVATYLDDVHCR